MIDAYATRFEAIDEDTKDLLFIVEMFDENAADVNIKTVVTVESWDELSSKIRECLVKMGLKTFEGDKDD